MLNTVSPLSPFLSVQRFGRAGGGSNVSIGTKLLRQEYEAAVQDVMQVKVLLFLLVLVVVVVVVVVMLLFWLLASSSASSSASPSSLAVAL